MTILYVRNMSSIRRGLVVRDYIADILGCNIGGVRPHTNFGIAFSYCASRIVESTNFQLKDGGLRRKIFYAQ